MSSIMNHGFGNLIDQALYESDEFRMYKLKVRQCPRLSSHDWTLCPFAHRGEKARRCDPRRYNYAVITCPSYRTGECERGETCHFLHGVFEHWLHPAKYRTQRCNVGLFCLQKVCFFAHSEHELRREQPSGGDLTRYHNWSFGEIRVPAYASAQGPVTHQEALVESSRVLHSLEMLNIRDGEYEIPRTLQGGRKFE